MLQIESKGDVDLWLFITLISRTRPSFLQTMLFKGHRSNRNISTTYPPHCSQAAWVGFSGIHHFHEQTFLLQVSQGNAGTMITRPPDFEKSTMPTTYNTCLNLIKYYCIQLFWSSTRTTRVQLSAFINARLQLLPFNFLQVPTIPFLDNMHKRIN